MEPFDASVSGQTRCSRPHTRRCDATEAAPGVSAGLSPQRWSCCTTKTTAQHDPQRRSRTAITSYAERLSVLAVTATHHFDTGRPRRGRKSCPSGLVELLHRVLPERGDPHRQAHGSPSDALGAAEV